jgi:excinuclease UvrABC helicase subunit UvrB
MEINKKVTVKLTTKDLEEIITEYLKSKGVDVKSVYFKVNGHNREDDWRAEFPLDYRLDEVVCKGVEI